MAITIIRGITAVADTGSAYVEVNTFADLPAAASHTGEIYVVLTSTGTWMVNRKEAGFYYSDGISWNRLGNWVNAFSDANFRVYNNSDNSKQVQFDVSGVSTATSRTLTIPNQSGTIALTSDLTGYVTSVAGTANRITSTGGTTPVIDISAAYVGQASITTLGTIGTGVWQGTSISTSFTDAKIKTVTGTLNRITIGGTATDPTFDISTSYAGQATIVTVGTLTSGATGAGFTVALSTSTITGTLGATNGGTAQSTYATGDTLYASATNTLSKLTGNITTAKQYLSQTGSGAASAAPVWATITGADITGAALTKVDDTNVTLTLGGTPTTALLRAASLTLGWTGTLAVARGGTAQSTYTDGQLLIGNTTGNTLAKATLTGTANQVIVTNGSGSITLSTPQDIGTGSSPTFNGLTLSGLTANTALIANGSKAIASSATTSTELGYVSGVTSAIQTQLNSKETALTFSTGLTRTTNTITANLSTGIAGGQSAIGGTAPSENLTLSSTADATKGKILFGTSSYDELNNRVGIVTTTPSYDLSFGNASRTIGIENATGAAGTAGSNLTIRASTGTATGSGGAGGGLLLIGAAATGDNTANRVGGLISLTAGNSAGSGVGAVITVTAGTGGPGTITTGAAGGAITLTAGTGGTGSLTAGAGGAVNINGGNTGGSATGGNGGAIILTGGSGNAGSAGGIINIAGGSNGGAGASITYTAGAASTGKGGSHIFNAGLGGASGAFTGGDVTFTSGNGGAAAGAAAGVLTFTTGAGTSTTTGGNGGALTMTLGNANGDGTVNRNGGSFSVTGGSSIRAGTAGAITLTAGSATTVATTPGTGGNVSITAGAGPERNDAGTTKVAGNGGTFTITSGAGGVETIGSTTNTGGVGGLLSITGGVGGATTAAVTTNNGGAGAAITISPGTGGAATGATTNNGGAGGVLTLTGGIGGAGATAAGTGGAIIFQTAATTSLAERARIKPDGTWNWVAQAAPASPAEGDMWVDSTQKSVAMFADGIKQFSPGVIFTQTADKTVTNTVTETSIIGTGVGTLTLPANLFVAGKTIRLRVGGIYSTPIGVASLIIKVKYGSTVIATITTTSLLSAASNLEFDGEVLITCRTTGASGTVMTHGDIEYATGVTGTIAVDPLNNAGATTTINTTTSNLLDVTIQWDSATTTRIAKSTVCTVEILN